MKRLLLTILAVFLIIEEWLWDFFAALGHYLLKLLSLDDFERWLEQTSPYMALLAIGIPFMIIIPINFAAVLLFLHGLVLESLAVEIFAKLFGTLLIARIFGLVKNQLLTFGLIAFIYTTITGWLRWAHEKIVDTAIYKFSKRLKARIKARVTELLNAKGSL